MYFDYVTSGCTDVDSAVHRFLNFRNECKFIMKEEDLCIIITSNGQAEDYRQYPT